MEAQMTSHPLAASFPSRRLARGGFTLVELLVVLLVLSVLGSVIVVGVIRARDGASVARTRGDLQTIASALEQYKADFGKYPPVALNVRGAHVLARALIGPGPATDDGQDGPGFRTVTGGRIYKPYLSADSLRVKQDGAGWVLLDAGDHPIEYFPRYFEHCDPGRNLVPADLVGDKNSTSAVRYRFDHRDGIITRQTLQGFLGDDSIYSNKIEGTESLRHVGPYIIGSPGLDGLWINVDNIPDRVNPPLRRQALMQNDDILNFEYK